MLSALRRVSTLALAVIAPIVVVGMFAVASSDNSLSTDFHNELYPEAQLLLDWDNPFPEPGETDLGQGRNLIWPPLAAFAVAPFTLLDPAAADWAVAIAGLVCFLASLRIVGVGDWRVYAIFALWPSVIGEIRTSHLTPALCLLVALAWRHRGRRVVPGIAIGAACALKFFLWPLFVWLWAMGRKRAAATAVAASVTSVLLVLPFTSLRDYSAVLIDLGHTFDQDSYNPYGLVVQAGLPSELGRAVTLVVGAVLLLACWRMRSFALGVAAALVLSPIVWLDYYAVAAIPLAAVRPRLSFPWLAPLITWGLLSAGVGAGNAWGTTRTLSAFGIVLAFAVAEEQRRAGRHGLRRPVPSLVPDVSGSAL